MDTVGAVVSALIRTVVTVIAPRLAPPPLLIVAVKVLEDVIAVALRLIVTDAVVLFAAKLTK
jgi:hypothetical protein